MCHYVVVLFYLEKTHTVILDMHLLLRKMKTCPYLILKYIILMLCEFGFEFGNC